MRGAMASVSMVLFASAAWPAAPEAPSETRIGKLAAAMQPGTFALLNQAGDASGYSGDLVDGVVKGNGVGSIFGYAHRAAYDPVSDTVYFVGQAHDGATEMVYYRVATNTWTNAPVPHEYWRGHAQDTNTINSTARELYVGAHVQSTNMRRFNLQTRRWSWMAQPATAGVPNGDPTAEYFPERDELLYVGGKTMAAWRRATDTWKRVAALPALGQRAPIARYSPIHKCVLIMGGADTHVRPARHSHAVYKYDAKGTVTRLKDGPASITVYINQLVAAADPVSGDFVFITAVLNKDLNDYTGKVELWKHDISTDTWTQLDSKIVPDTSAWWTRKGSPFAVVVTPISKHGVIMFMSAAGRRSKVYLYKHAQAPARKASGESRAK